MTATEAPELVVRPLTPDRLDDVVVLFGTNKTTAGCSCMWFLLTNRECQDGWGALNQARFAEFATAAAEPAGLVAYRGAVPVGWCAAGPRSRYPRLLRSPLLRERVPAEDDTVWLVPCFFVRRTARGTGVTGALIEAAVTLAATAGARAVEGLPYADGPRRPAGDAYVGVLSMFAGSGFTEVRRASASRVLVRRELRPVGRQPSSEE